MARPSPPVPRGATAAPGGRPRSHRTHLRGLTLVHQRVGRTSAGRDPARVDRRRVRGYVCDLAVDPEYQGQGIGRELLRRCVCRVAGGAVGAARVAHRRRLLRAPGMDADRERMGLATGDVGRARRPATRVRLPDSPRTDDESPSVFDGDGDRRQHANGHGGARRHRGGAPRARHDGRRAAGRARGPADDRALASAENRAHDGAADGGAAHLGRAGARRRVAVAVRPYRSAAAASCRPPGPACGSGRRAARGRAPCPRARRRVTAPSTREPAGIATRPPTATSRATCASTRSSTCDVSLDTVFFNCRPMTESADTTSSSTFGSCHFGCSTGSTRRAVHSRCGSRWLQARGLRRVRRRVCGRRQRPEPARAQAPRSGARRLSAVRGAAAAPRPFPRWPQPGATSSRFAAVLLRLGPARPAWPRAAPRHGRPSPLRFPEPAAASVRCPGSRRRASTAACGAGAVLCRVARYPPPPAARRQEAPRTASPIRVLTIECSSDHHAD